VTLVTNSQGTVISYNPENGDPSTAKYPFFLHPQSHNASMTLCSQLTISSIIPTSPKREHLGKRDSSKLFGEEVYPKALFDQPTMTSTNATDTICWNIARTFRNAIWVSHFTVGAALPKLLIFSLKNTPWCRGFPTMY
jgi:hypothetical protein